MILECSLSQSFRHTSEETCCESSNKSLLPQLYVNGELVGGADIVEEMHSKGELKQLLS